MIINNYPWDWHSEDKGIYSPPIHSYYNSNRSVQPLKKNVLIKSVKNVILLCGVPIHLD